MIIKINNFQGELSDISAKTATLVTGQRSCVLQQSGVTVAKDYVSKTDWTAQLSLSFQLTRFVLESWSL